MTRDELRNSCERIVLDRGVDLSDTAVDVELFMDHAVVDAFASAEEMKAVVIPSAVTHPLPEKEIFFPELERAVRSPLFQDPEHAVSELRCRPLVRVDVQAPVRRRVTRAKISLGTKTVTVPAVLIDLIGVRPADLKRMVGTETVKHHDLIGPGGDAFQRPLDEVFGILGHDDRADGLAA